MLFLFDDDWEARCGASVGTFRNWLSPIDDGESSFMCGPC